MTTVLEEVTSQDITNEHVVRRVEDWQRRIDGLYDSMEAWLPSGWQASRVRTVTMNSDFMQHFGVKPRQIPVLDIVSPNGNKAFVEPRALWVIGINGRLDLYSGDRHFVIADHAEIFAPPAWKIADFKDRSRLRDLDRDSFLHALGQ